MVGTEAKTFLFCWNDHDGFVREAGRELYRHCLESLHTDTSDDKDYLNGMTKGNHNVAWFTVPTNRRRNAHKQKLCAHISKIIKHLQRVGGTVIVDLGKNDGKRDRPSSPWDILEADLDYKEVSACNLGTLWEDNHWIE